MKLTLPLHAWDIPEVVSIKQVHTGLLNQTFILHTKNSLYVLQQLHPAVSLQGCTSNYNDVTRFLLQRKNITQIVMPTITGKLLHIAHGQTWRMLQGIPGEVHTKVTTSKKLATEGGKLLSQFHTALKFYKKPLAKTLPMFQYDTVLQKLKQNLKYFSLHRDKEIRDAAVLLQREFPKLLLPKNLKRSIIHTDPKISNFLFNKNNNGICMIDLDTIQKLSPLYDIGDAVRSWCSNEEDDLENTFHMDVYQNFIKGYLDNSKNLLSKTEQNLIPQACKLIMLGLATRFLNDYADNNYFGWDPKRYTSRKAHNKARCLGQIALYTSALKFL